MKDIPVLVFLAAFFFALRPILTADSPAPLIDDSDFIRTSCDATSYPDVCFASLSGYAASVQNDPAGLAIVAIRVALSKTRKLASYLANLTHPNDPRAAGALYDCCTTTEDTVDEMRDSLKQMKHLSPTGPPRWFRYQVSNVQTWMSTALTNEETCTDGFEDVGDEPVKADVCERVDDVKKLTCNALALVNRFADWSLR